ncbi:MAG TPA: hypothetical protein VM370_11865, partial [Candidatus Thermoplasmatota archaeon]|nr:hypothetical protein [Candidatus Thermoplasmatota archaeon]
GAGGGAGGGGGGGAGGGGGGGAGSGAVVTPVSSSSGDTPPTGDGAAQTPGLPLLGGLVAVGAAALALRRRG